MASRERNDYREGWITVLMERTAKRFLPRIGCLFLALLLVACGATMQPQQRLTSTVGRNVKQMAPFRDCELHAFIAWDAARQVLLFHVTEAQLLAGPHVGDFQIALYHEIFAHLEQGALHDYNHFAASRLLACTQRASIPTRDSEDVVASCFARLDIVMLLRADMLRGSSEAESKANVAQRLTSRQLYPVSLIDALTPKVYNAPSEDDFFDLRRSVFESCLAR